MLEVSDDGIELPDEVKRCASMWRAVIAQHLRDFATYGDDISVSRQRHKLEAAQWFGFEGGPVPHGSEGFFEVCELAVMDAGAFLARLEEIMGMNLSDAARCFVLTNLAMQINRGPLEDRLRPSPDSGV